MVHHRCGNVLSEVDPALLEFERRELVIDGIEEKIICNGKQTVDLRRRTMLKKLMFLFASTPLKSYTKEEIVEKVWGVEYHPLRHDAALFTNIMRLRRLLGDKGDEMLRVGDNGYTFMPPADFLYLERA